MSEETVKTAWVDENGKHLTSGHTENYPTPEELRESFGRGLTCGIIEAAAEMGAGPLDQPTMAAEILKSAHIHSMSDVPDYVDEFDRDRLASIAGQMWSDAK
jgi:hypothetical protein